MLSLLIVGQAGIAGAAEGGGYAGGFLRLGIGARATALGGAFSAAVDGPSSVYWNPAAGPWCEGRGLAFSHWFLGLDRALSYAGYMQRLPYDGALGLAWVGARTSDIDGRDSDGRPTELYADQRHAFYFNLGFKPHPLFSVGLSVKPYYRRVAEQTASGAGFDMGALVRPADEILLAIVGYEIGITTPTGRSTGAYWSWNTRDYWGGGLGGIPREISRSDRFLKRLRIGMSWRFGHHVGRLLPKLRDVDAQAFVDFEKVEMFDPEVLVGVEVGAAEGLLLRAGHGVQGFVAGVGVAEKLPLAGMRLDYAVAHMDLADQYTHQVQVSFRR